MDNLEEPKFKDMTKNERAKQYYHKHRDEICAKHREKYRLHPEEFKKYPFKDEYRIKNKETNSNRRRQNRLFVWQYKQSRSCSICGESHPACLDFHHTNSDKKEIGIARMFGSTIERIMGEIAKCDLLCSNCHRKLHNHNMDMDSG